MDGVLRASTRQQAEPDTGVSILVLMDGVLRAARITCFRTGKGLFQSLF